MREYYLESITPEKDVIFVFGSNPEGRHGMGAAKIAHKFFGAKYGVGEGLVGNSYALPTKDLRRVTKMEPSDIIAGISRLYDCARQNPSLKFKVAYNTCLDNISLCGYSERELAEMFKSASDNIPENIIFADHWKIVIEENL